jgi:hypothetical protein
MHESEEHSANIQGRKEAERFSAAQQEVNQARSKEITTARAVHVRSSLVPLTIPGTKFSTRPYVRSCGELTTRPHVRRMCGAVRC